jgi:hypothetical protein
MAEGTLRTDIPPEWIEVAAKAIHDSDWITGGFEAKDADECWAEHDDVARAEWRKAALEILPPIIAAIRQTK